MKAHPYADLFPRMGEDELARLTESIRENGQLHPIIVHEGQILDGRNRYAACLSLGIEPRVVEFDGADALRHAVALNADRRQMKEAPRAMVAARLANMNEGRPAGQSETGQICPVSISLEDAAKMLDVSRRSVVTARKIIKEAAENVTARVDAGKLTLNAAMKTIQPKRQMEVDSDNSRTIQQLALDAGLSWAHKGPEISKALREATGEKTLRKVDLADPATRGTVQKVLAGLAGRTLEEQYQAHRADVATLTESAQQKLARLVDKELQHRLALFDQEVRDKAREQLPEEVKALRAAKERADGEFKKYAAMRKGIPAQMTEADYKFLLNVLHPDRAPEDRREKFARAFDIVRQLDAYIKAFEA